MNWYCINTNPNKEFVAEYNINNQGFNTFLPTFIHNYPKKGPTTRPLFPSYLFVEFEVSNGTWYSLCHTIGVKRLFSYNVLDQKNSYGYIRPIPIPSAVIAALQHLQTSNSESVSQRLPTIDPQSRVKVIDGPFANYHGICQWSNDKRIILLMNILHGQVEVSFTRNAVELV